MPKNGLQHPGEVSLDSFRVYPHGSTQYIEIIGNVVSANLYEDLYKTTVYGEIVLGDASGLRRHMPILGGEKAVFKWKTPGYEDSSVFECNIVGIANRAIDGKFEGYILQLASTGVLSNDSERLSKAYSGKISDVAVQIWQDSLGKNPRSMFTQPVCDARIKFVAANWKPFRAFAYLTMRALNARSIPDYVFYQTIAEGWKFDSLSTLLTARTHQKYLYAEAELGSLDADFRKVESYSFPNSAQLLDAIRRGAYANTVICPDITTKSISEEDHSYFDWFSTSGHLERHGVLRIYPDSEGRSWATEKAARLHVVPEQKFFQNELETVGIKNVIKKRSASFVSLQHITGTLVVPGDSKRHVGEVIEFYPPGVEPLPGSTYNKDTYISGRFLITALNHAMVKGSYKCILEIAKDSVSQQYPDEKTFDI